MALESVFGDLVRSLADLREEMAVVHTTIAEDTPPYRAVALPDILSDLLLSIMGQLEESSEAATQALAAVTGHVDMDGARHALALCHAHFNSLVRSYNTDLMSYERISELLRVGRDRDQAWKSWSRSVKEGLDQCRQGIYDANEHIRQCWEEIGERVGMTSLSVQNTTVGQNVNLPTSAAKALDLDLTRIT